MSLIKLLTCDKGGLLLASETPAIAQSVSDSMKWNTRSEVAVQILSNFFVGFITGRGIKDRNKKGDVIDTDWSTAPLGIGAYIQADFVHYKDWVPEDSFKAGLGWSAGNYALGSAYRIPGLKQPFWKNIGTELSSWTDLKTTALSTAAGYGGDKIEEYLQNSNSVLKNGVLTEGKLTNALNSKASSSKKIISKDY